VSVVEVMVLHEVDIVRRHTARLAEAEHVDSGAGRQRRQEELEWLRGGAGTSVGDRLVRPDDVGTEVRVNALSTWEADSNARGGGSSSP